ncbi:MAG: NYN domain-containing protein [bacterium]
MIIIIDGYNLLRQVYPRVKGCLEGQRKHFVKFLAYYRQKKGQELKDVIVVFDAGPCSHATRDVCGGVVVMFSGQKSTADDWIEEYVERYKDQEKLLVTLDRELIRRCEKYNTVSMDVFEFYAIVKDSIIKGQECKSSLEVSSEFKKFKHDQDVVGQGKIDSKALDLLMEQASFHIFVKDKKSDDELINKKINKSSTKLSKQERKIYSVLKKIR